MNSILNKIENHMRASGMVDKGAKVVVGISGGSDSICLAAAMQQLGYEVVGVHCNFHLRGEESMRDELFVKTFCQERQIELHKIDFDTEAYAKEKKISIEMAARELRYDKFRKIKEEHHAAAIAVGHHRDDNTETFILNAVRGTGIKGLCGIQSINGDIIRPLLCLSRTDIIRYIEHENLSYVTDHTNMEDEYSRNKVRLNIMPILKDINEGAASNICTTIENLNEAMKVYNASIRQSIDRCCTNGRHGETIIDIDELQKQPSPISVLHEVLSPSGFNREHLKAMLEALQATGKMFEANGRRVLINRKEIIVEGDSYDKEIIQQTMPVEDIEIKKDSHYAYIDADKMKNDKLTIRTVKNGDTFAPFGMKGRRKLVSDFLTDMKLSRFEKERQTVVCDGDEVVWIAGLRSSELYRIDGKTRKVIVLSVEEDS